MRILIFGATGMLGHKLYQRLRIKFDVFATIRSDFGSINRFGLFERPSIVEYIDVTKPELIRRAVELVRPDCVLNAIGLIKQVPSSKDVIQTLTINSIFPHRLAELSTEYGFRLIMIGTDCVFDGKKGNYSEDDAPDARDLYGMSKLLGETTGENSLTIRTSIIGRELATSHSILEWFLARRETRINGYVNAVYSGFPTIVLTDIISGIITKRPMLKGLYHVSSDPISKFDLLSLINKHYRTGNEIQPFEDYVIDRSLDSAKFRRETGFRPDSWESMVSNMAADPTPYDRWQSGNK